MYLLSTPLTAVAGIGPKLAEHFAERHLYTVKDLLLFVPLRYEDTSQQVTIDDVPINELVTLAGEVVTTSNFYKGPRSIQSATIVDGTGKLKVMWFNNRFILDKLKKGQSYYFSGKVNDRRILVQPAVEDIKTDTLHTNRLVPIYSHIPTLKQGTLRRILHHIITGLTELPDVLPRIETHLIDLTTTLKQIHFPDSTELIVQSRQRLALEEILCLMKKSQHVKAQWQTTQSAPQVSILQSPIPSTLPFSLTLAQHKAVADILGDIQERVPMNRLLVGDVGSGKTVVAGIAALHTLLSGYSVALVAPTRILAEQHFHTLNKLFPDLHIELVFSSPRQKKAVAVAESTAQPNQVAPPTFYVGTHALLNRLDAIQPGLLVYDEQHRFGVAQRSISATQSHRQPHVLTMSATPIPRSLMLTVFTHLSLSTLDELPQGRVPTKTWVVPENKRSAAHEWLAQEVTNHQSQALVVCPFIDPSQALALENVAAVTERFETLKQQLTLSSPHLRVALLHGRLSKTDQAAITTQLFNREIDVLVTTPIVEVGIDLPAASIMVIEAAERFGLASLHQLRGRVGRAGQQGYCLLFTNANQGPTWDRLHQFATMTKGSDVAELDLTNRGAGDIFGTKQHGFDELVFANWADATLIAQARHVYDQLSTHTDWQPLFDHLLQTDTTPLAN